MVVEVAMNLRAMPDVASKTMSHPRVAFSTIPEALDELRQGQFVVVLDDEDRENEGDLIMAASLATPESLAFAIRHTTGILCAPMAEERATKLELRRMVDVGKSTDPRGTAFTVSVDAVGTSTGVSAKDRCQTFRALSDPNAKAEDFHHPGHIFPLVAKDGGVAERRGHTEAAVDLLKLAGLPEIGLIGELVNDDGTMKRTGDCNVFARERGLKMITVQQIVDFCSQLQHLPRSLTTRLPASTTSASERNRTRLVGECSLPIQLRNSDFGVWHLKCFYSQIDTQHHLVLRYGQIDSTAVILTRLHSECITGDVLGSQRCDCGDQLHRSFELIHERGSGIVIYNRGHEGRGIGVASKIHAYDLQQSCDLDTYEANRALGFADDLRKYDSAREILKELGIRQIELLAGNPLKERALRSFVKKVTPLDTPIHAHNGDYLRAKSKNGHAQTVAGSQKGDDHKPGRQQADPSSRRAPSKSSTNPDSPAGSEIQTQKSVKSTPRLLSPSPSLASSLKIGIVRASWNELLLGPFTEAIKSKLLNSGINANNVKEVIVPGSFELPWTAQQLAPKCDSVLCVGLLLKGETAHFEVLSDSVAHALMQIQLKTGTPVVNGVFNCFTEQQAVTRCAPDSELVGSLASTVIHMAALKREFAQ